MVYVLETVTSLLKYRRLRKLTQSELAQRAGISLYLLRRYESGDTPVDDEHIKTLADALSVTPSELLPKPGIKQTVSELMLKNRKLLDDPNDNFARGYHAALMDVLSTYESEKP